MWAYTNKIVSALLFICLISLGLPYAKMRGFLNFLIMSFLKIELFSKQHNSLMEVAG